MMAGSAASKAVAAAEALDAFLRDYIPASVHATPTPSPTLNRDEPTSASALEAGMQEPPPRPAHDPAGSRITAAGAPLCLPNTDWLRHRLVITGPATAIEAFRAKAAGAGITPWQLDLHALEEDWFHLLARPAWRELSLTGARRLAAQLREAVEQRHTLALSRVGHSQVCPLDLHELLPVSPDVLRLGPNHPDALAWLWQHWGTTEALRHVALLMPGKDAVGSDIGAGQGDVLRLTFWSADWTPWRAFQRLRADWPALRFDVQPDYLAD